MGLTSTASLRWALLAAIGGVPLACGGAVKDQDDGNTSSTNGGGGQGPSSRAGSDNRGGSSISRPVRPRECTNPTPQSDGFIHCSEGFSHRSKTVKCTPPEPDPSAGASGVGIDDGSAGASDGGCHSDQDCNADPLSYCARDDLGDQVTTSCERGCQMDEDCGPGYICGCADHWPGGECIRSDCKLDTDCGSGFFCASYREGCGYGGFACQRADDECRSDAECDYGACASTQLEDGTSHRACDYSVCGRPFLVESSARVAPLTDGGAWSLGGAPRLDHLSVTERSALAAHWARMGQMEHASIAAFARFSLQLLSLGASPELVDACTQALADETAHTKLCFALASAYAGRALGPGPLDVSHSLEVTSLADIVDLVIAEGCFGETSAALEALEAAETATDPVVIAAYAQIARDEQRHAELAFRFVRWALEREPETITPRVVHALAEAPHSSPAVQDVVEPCLYAVLARRQAA